MKLDHHLGIIDSIIIIMGLMVPTAIGIFFRFSSGRQKTMDEYFFAERSASMFPIIMSLTASMISSLLILGTSAEVYKFGTTYYILLLASSLGMITASYVFVPVYFQCNVSSVYEYLEMRFGRLTRTTVSFLYCLQMMFFSSCVLYGPALVMNSVMDISVEFAIVLCGSVCTFYCFMGGLKAVLWTDVFQQILMFLCILAVVSAGIGEVGLEEFYNRALTGGRLNFFNFSFDLTERYTTWNIFIRGFSISIGFYGTNQIYIQRFLSMGQLKRAQSALLWSILPLMLCSIIGNMIGIVLYAVFYLCDPILSKQPGLQKYDQLVPYFIITRFHTTPGLTGICIAGIFSGALSTISSAQNTLAMITVIDFIKPYFPGNLSEKRQLLIGKALAIVYGVVFICFTLAVTRVDSMLAAALLVIAVFEGPIVTVFCIGVLTRKASDKIIATSLILASIITGWIGFNILFSGYRSTTLPLETTGCLNFNSSVIGISSLNSSCPTVESCLQVNLQKPFENEIFYLYKISPFWLSFIGIISTIFFALFLVLIIGWNRNVIPADSELLSPITRYWFKQKKSESIVLREDITNGKKMEDKCEVII